MVAGGKAAGAGQKGQKQNQGVRQSQQKAKAKPDSAYSDMKMEACSETEPIVPAPRSIRAEATRCTAALGWAGHGGSAAGADAAGAVVKKKHHAIPGSGSAAAIAKSQHHLVPRFCRAASVQHCSLCWAGTQKLGLQGGAGRARASWRSVPVQPGFSACLSPARVG